MLQLKNMCTEFVLSGLDLPGWGRLVPARRWMVEGEKVEDINLRLCRALTAGEDGGLSDSQVEEFLRLIDEVRSV